MSKESKLYKANQIGATPRQVAKAALRYRPKSAAGTCLSKRPVNHPANRKRSNAGAGTRERSFDEVADRERV